MVLIEFLILSGLFQDSIVRLMNINEMKVRLRKWMKLIDEPI